MRGAGHCITLTERERARERERERDRGREEGGKEKAKGGYKDVIFSTRFQYAHQQLIDNPSLMLTRNTQPPKEAPPTSHTPSIPCFLLWS